MIYLFMMIRMIVDRYVAMEHPCFVHTVMYCSVGRSQCHLHPFVDLVLSPGPDRIQVSHGPFDLFKYGEPISRREHG